jgi:flagellar biosynthesis protein FliR
VGIEELIRDFFLIFARVGGLMLAAPIFGSKSVPPLVKISLIVWFSIFCFFSVDLSYPVVALMSLQNYLLIVLQFMAGLFMGFVWKLLFDMFVVMGNIVSMQMGLSFAIINDPSSDSTTPVLGSFFNILVLLFFLSMNGPALMLAVLQESFAHIIVMPDLKAAIDFGGIIPLFNLVFSYALSTSLVILTSLIIANIGFGLMGRLAPQLNVIQLGFPVFIVFGFFIIYCSIEYFSAFFMETTEQIVLFLNHV